MRTLIRAGPHCTYDCAAAPCLQDQKPAELLTGFRRKSLKPDEWMPATCAGQYVSSVSNLRAVVVGSTASGQGASPESSRYSANDIIESLWIAVDGTAVCSDSRSGVSETNQGMRRHKDDLAQLYTNAKTQKLSLYGC